MITFSKAARTVGSLVLLTTGACSGVPDEGSQGFDGDAEVSVAQQAITGCSLANAVPLTGPNSSNRLGSNACAAIIPPFLPSWWQYSDGTARVQIANFNDQDPNENAFPLTVEWENTCGTEQGSVTYTQPWQQHELGHPSANCSIVMKMGGNLTEDVLIFWGA